MSTDVCTMHVIHVIILCGAVISAMGYSTTHVANGFYETIYVMVDMVKLTSEEKTIGVGVGPVSACATIQSTYGDFIEAGFAKVSPLGYVGISPDAKNVYISIWSLSQGYIWKNIPQKDDISFIVQLNGDVVKAKYGKIWIDENGTNQQPTPAQIADAAQGSQTCSSGTSNRFVKSYFWAVQMCLTLILLAHFCK